MASVKNVANFFVNLAQKQNEADMGDLITNMRLQKLLYFAQGCSLARYGKPLFCAPIEAWNYGPVVPEVYRRYKVFGRQGIVTSDHPADDALRRKNKTFFWMLPENMTVIPHPSL